MSDFQTALIRMRRSLLIWSWWYGIIIAFIIDSIAFVYIDDVMNSPIEFARIYQCGLSLVLLLQFFPLPCSGVSGSTLNAV